MINIKYPDNCKTEASRISRLRRMLRLSIINHNSSIDKSTKNLWFKKMLIISTEISYYEKLARSGNYIVINNYPPPWADELIVSKIWDDKSRSIIYPNSVNKLNDGSVLVFLYSALQVLDNNDITIEQYPQIVEELQSKILESEFQEHWDYSISDEVI